MSMKRERGAILLLVLLALVVVTVLCSAFVNLSFYEQRFSQSSQSVSQAFYLGESAVDRGLSWLRAQLVPPSVVQQPFGAQPVVLGTGSYLTTITPDPTNNGTNPIKRFTIQGEGRTGTWAIPSATRISSLIVQTESFAQYAYFTNSERSWPNGTQVFFITGDKIEGPTHTNGQFSMFGRPIFEGPVSSAATSIYLWGGSQVTQPVFAEPPKLGVPQKEFPTSYPQGIIDSAQNGGTVLRGDTSVSLRADGTMRVTNAAQGLVNQAMPLPANGVLYVDGGNVTLQGTLKGQLTLGTSGNVRVVDSVTYASDPNINPNSKDLLGIVAGQNVQIAQEAPSDVRIDASIMALNHSFGVENWWQGPPKGTLTVNGGIIQANRGIVGTFNGSTGNKASGYTKDYHYDKRLKSMSPPSFPTTGDYVSLVWQQQ